MFPKWPILTFRRPIFGVPDRGVLTFFFKFIFVRNLHNGRRVASHVTNDGELTVNVSEMAQGAYFVRVTGDTQTAVRKLIVK